MGPIRTATLLLALTAWGAAVPAHAAWLPAPAAQSAGGEGDAEARAADDVRFAENLARYRYFDLAIALLDELETDDAGDHVRGLLQHTHARVLRRAAESTADDTDRLRWLTESIDLLRDWGNAVSQWSHHDRRTQALQDLAEMLNMRGAMHGERGERSLAEADFKDAEDAYKTLQDDAEELADFYDSNGQEDAADEMQQLWVIGYYWRGKNAIDWAEFASDRSYRLERAQELLTDFQWEVEGGSLLLFWAQFYEAKALALQEQYVDAVDLLQGTLQNVTEDFWDYLDEFGPQPRRVIADLMDALWGALAEYQVAAGDLAAAEGVIATMRAQHAKTEQPMGRTGYQVLLDWAETLSAQGQSSEASDIVKLVSDEAVGLPEGERARRLMAGMVDSGNITDLSAGVLLASADGKYQEQEFAAAALLFQRGLAAIANATERQQFELQGWEGVARSLRRDRRYLEAALAYERLLDVAVARGQTDIVDQAARLMHDSFDRRYGETGSAFDKGLRDTAARRLTELGIEADVVFAGAKEIYDDAAALARVESQKPQASDRDFGPSRAQFEAAAAAFADVDASAPSYESALVYHARSLAGAGKTDEALAQFDVMLERAAAPAHEPTSNDARNKREAAVAQAVYYKAELLLDDAVRRPDEALTLIAGFETRFAKQTGFFEQVKYQRVKAHTLRKAPRDADEALADLIDFNSNSAFVSAGAFLAARCFKDAADEAADKQLLERAAELMWIYCERSGFASFSNTLACGDWFLEVGRHKDAERAYAAAEDAWAGRIDDRNVDQARMGLARALDLQKDFGKSRRYWLDLVDRNPRDPGVLMGAGRSFGGWLEKDASGNIVEIKGSGNFQQAFDLWETLHRGQGGEYKYKELWWESKLGALYAYYMLGATDPSKLVDARKVLNNQMLLTPRFEQDILETLDEQDRFEPRFHEFFKHLDRKLPPL